MKSYANAGIGPVGYIVKKYIYPEVFTADPNKGPLLSALGFAGQVLGQLCMSSLSFIALVWLTQKPLVSLVTKSDER